MEATEKKGMSKGCMVGLIIAGVIIAIVLIGGLTAWFYWDDIVDLGTVSVAAEIKRFAAENSQEGVDTIQFNAMLDEFVVTAQADSNTSSVFALFIQGAKPIMEDKTVTAEEVSQLQAIIGQLYPELAITEEMIEPADSSAVVDSIE